MVQCLRRETSVDFPGAQLFFCVLEGQRGKGGRYSASNMRSRRQENVLEGQREATEK